MSKLWIAHSQVRVRNALARLSDLAPQDRIAGELRDDVFADAPPPLALIMGIGDDLERELDFLVDHETQLGEARRLYLVRRRDVEAIRKLTGAPTRDLVELPPDPHALRARLREALGPPPTLDLSTRRYRARVARDFETWFADDPLPGLRPASDPALARLPIILRGVPGSGRSRIARYVETLRGPSLASRSLRVAADGEDPMAALRPLFSAAGASSGGLAAGVATRIWLEEIDRFTPATQRLLAEWIRLGPPPETGLGAKPSWMVIARPELALDGLEPSLATALGPLFVDIPALEDTTDALEIFADRVITSWCTRFGGPRRGLDEGALESLQTIAWSGDRLAVERVLQRALAVGGEAPIRADDLDADLDSLGARREATHPGAEANNHGSEVAPEPLKRAGDAVHPVGEANNHGSEVVPDPVERARDAVSATLLGSREAARGLDRGFDEDPSRRMAEEATVWPISPRPIGSPRKPPRPSFEATRSAAAKSATPSPPPDQNPEAALDRIERGERRGPANPDWRRLARSLSHEIRNPLVSIRTFAELLPEHFEDASFRERFSELVGRDVRHIDEVIGRLSRAAEREKPEPAAVDVSAMLEQLLESRRLEIGERRLLVLRELEREAPLAWADPESLEIALSGLLDRALAALPERGDLFVATRRIDRGSDGAPRLRILMRHHSPEGQGLTSASLPDAAIAANAIEYVLAETVVATSGGRLTIDANDAQETLILIDLQTPEAGLQATSGGSQRPRDEEPPHRA